MGGLLAKKEGAGGDVGVKAVRTHILNANTSHLWPRKGGGQRVLRRPLSSERELLCLHQIHK